MEIEYSLSRDGQTVFSINKIQYHSSYSPEKEAKRFSDNLNLSFEPEYLFIVEPGFDYLYNFLKNKYPNSKIGIIRILDNLKQNSSSWDFIIPYSDKLFSNFSEESFINSNIIIWPAAQTLFKSQVENIVFQYKEKFESSKTLLITREVFEKKWLINSLNNIKYIKNYVSLTNKIDLPVLIAASGPSLIPLIKLIKTNRNKIFIIALSSAIKALLKNNIIPDLCFSTDGGFWAEKHLLCLNKNLNTFLALPFEGTAPKNILKTIKVLPLKYNDELISDFLPDSIITAKRNGTVSGTALEFAISNSTSDIYFAGLDMAGQKGFQHIQPNELELTNSITDNRISTIEKRLTASQFNTSSLALYLSWFNSFNSSRKIFRIIDNKQNSIKSFDDISSDEFNQKLQSYKNPTNKTYFNENKSILKSLNLSTIISFLISAENRFKIITQLFPLDNSTLKHTKNQNNKLILNEKINDNYNTIIKKISGLLN